MRHVQYADGLAQTRICGEWTGGRHVERCSAEQADEQVELVGQSTAEIETELMASSLSKGRSQGRFDSLVDVYDSMLAMVRSHRTRSSILKPDHVPTELGWISVFEHLRFGSLRDSVLRACRYDLC